LEFGKPLRRYVKKHGIDYFKRMQAYRYNSAGYTNLISPISKLLSVSRTVLSFFYEPSSSEKLKKNKISKMTEVFKTVTLTSNLSIWARVLYLTQSATNIVLVWTFPFFLISHQTFR